MLVQVYRRAAVSRKWVYEWFKRFRKGKETTEDQPRAGRPSTSRTPEMIEKLRQMLGQDRGRTLRLIAEELDIRTNTARRTASSAMNRIRGRFAPDLCRTSSQMSRKQNGWKLLETSFPCVTRIHCFWKISSREMRSGVTSSNRNQNGNRWRGVHRLRRDLQKSKVKTMLIAFFDNKGIIHKEFVPAGKNVNAAFYQTVWTDCYCVSCGVVHSYTRLQNGCCSTIMPLNPCAPLPGQMMVSCAWSPSLLPDMVPASFFLFLRFKAGIKGAHVADMSATKDRVTAVLRSIPQKAFADCCRKL